MYDKQSATIIKEKVDKSTLPILAEDYVDYINGYRRLKYYYPNNEMRATHIDQMQKNGYKFYSDENVYDKLYDDVFNSSEIIKVSNAIFYEYMKPFINIMEEI